MFEDKYHDESENPCLDTILIRNECIRINKLQKFDVGGVLKGVVGYPGSHFVYAVGVLSTIYNIVYYNKHTR